MFERYVISISSKTVVGVFTEVAPFERYVIFVVLEINK